MRKVRRPLVALFVAILLAVALAVPGGAALAVASATVSVTAPAEVPEDSDFTARVEITYVEKFSAAEFVVTFDGTVLAFIGCSNGELDGQVISASCNPLDPDKIKVLATWADLYPGISGAGYLVDIDFHVIGTGCETSAITLSEGKISDEDMVPIEAEWLGASVHVGGVPPVVDSCDAAGDKKDDFDLEEVVHIQGADFAPSTEYDVWIVPYEQCTYVTEGNVLADLGWPGLVTSIMTEPDGSIPPTAIWTVPLDRELISTLWEIVVDNGDGIYHGDDDGLDALACEEHGFHIIPEALTIILLTVGLACLGGYFVLRRRKSTETNA